MSLNLLKDITIKQAEPKEKDYTLNDGGVSNELLNLAVSKS